ncbi:MAG: hypothetical protein A2539_00220 [Elusimicrobia bacterium RIFOXYD2_FULL_34_15]|nr:MAG: hypothetical protein A2539_00220 [Elusimicrobia bacterium RIFOXYD2_FULL_34_15]
MKIPMVDLKTNYLNIKKEIDYAINSVLNKTDYILGEEVCKFENDFAKYCDTKYAVSVANGTDALRIALISAGISKGDEVITTPFTFIATTEAIVQSGGIPVFSDIDSETYNINPDEIEKKITKKTKAILPVHLYGHPCNMKKITAIAKKYNLQIIEDCAQSFSSEYKLNNKWKRTGSLGDVGCFSFYPAKNLGCYGDGGMITTNNKTIYENAKMLRDHGQYDKYYYKENGFNSRLDTIQAAILSVKLKYIDEWTNKRNKIAEKYNKILENIADVPIVQENCRHSYNYYSICLKNKLEKEKVQQNLLKNGIACQIYYPQSLHLQEVYKYLGYKKGDLPVSENIQDQVLSLPMYPELNDGQIKIISDRIKEKI